MSIAYLVIVGGLPGHAASAILVRIPRIVSVGGLANIAIVDLAVFPEKLPAQGATSL